MGLMERTEHLTISQRSRAGMSRAVLVDLDGTLVDTAPELATAANAMLAEYGLEPLPLAQVRAFIGQGVGPLVSHCLDAAAGVPNQEAVFDDALQRFVTHYQRLNGSAATVYPGAVEGLERLRAAGFRLGCITNKAARFALPLLEATGLAARFDAVTTSDQAGVCKPHPGIFLRACERLGAAPRDAVVIGDSANDALGARAAGCTVLLVTYGYSEGRGLHEIDCDGVVADLVEAAAAITSGGREA